MAIEVPRARLRGSSREAADGAIPTFSSALAATSESRAITSYTPRRISRLATRAMIHAATTMTIDVSRRPMNKSASFAKISLSVASQTASHTAPGSTPQASIRPELSVDESSTCIGSIPATLVSTPGRGPE